MKNVSLVIFSISIAFCAACAADGISTLVDVGKSMEGIQKAYDKETKSYDLVKRAVGLGTISKGQKKEEIIKLYGEPVIATNDNPPAREKWVYKPANSTFFDGAKIYLYFDSNGVLDEIKSVNA